MLQPSASVTVMQGRSTREAAFAQLAQNVAQQRSLSASAPYRTATSAASVAQHLRMVAACLICASRLYTSGPGAYRRQSQRRHVAGDDEVASGGDDAEGTTVSDGSEYSAADASGGDDGGHERRGVYPGPSSTYVGPTAGSASNGDGGASGSLLSAARALKNAAGTLRANRTRIAETLVSGVFAGRGSTPRGAANVPGWHAGMAVSVHGKRELAATLFALDAGSWALICTCVLHVLALGGVAGAAFLVPWLAGALAFAGTVHASPVSVAGLVIAPTPRDIVALIAVIMTLSSVGYAIPRALLALTARWRMNGALADLTSGGFGVLRGADHGRPSGGLMGGSAFATVQLAAKVTERQLLFSFPAAEHATVASHRALFAALLWVALCCSLLAVAPVSGLVVALHGLVTAIAVASVRHSFGRKAHRTIAWWQRASRTAVVDGPPLQYDIAKSLRPSAGLGGSIEDGTRAGGESPLRPSSAQLPPTHTVLPMEANADAPGIVSTPNSRRPRADLPRTPVQHGRSNSANSAPSTPATGAAVGDPTATAAGRLMLASTSFDVSGNVIAGLPMVSSSAAAACEATVATPAHVAAVRISDAITDHIAAALHVVWSATAVFAAAAWGLALALPEFDASASAAALLGGAWVSGAPSTGGATGAFVEADSGALAAAEHRALVAFIGTAAGLCVVAIEIVVRWASRMTWGGATAAVDVATILAAVTTDSALSRPDVLFQADLSPPVTLHGTRATKAPSILHGWELRGACFGASILAAFVLLTTSGFLTSSSPRAGNPFGAMGGDSTADAILLRCTVQLDGVPAANTSFAMTALWGTERHSLFSSRPFARHPTVSARRMLTRCALQGVDRVAGGTAFGAAVTASDGTSWLFRGAVTMASPGLCVTAAFHANTTASRSQASTTSDASSASASPAEMNLDGDASAEAAAAAAELELVRLQPESIAGNARC